MKICNALFRYYEWITMIFIAFCVCSGANALASSLEIGKEKSAVCMACHGAQGVSANPIWPNLAGQHQAYLMKQLHDFKKGELRHSPVMSPFVAALTDEEIEAIAYFYSKQTRAEPSPSKKNELGEKLYRVGDAQKHIPACIACHGPQALGNPLGGFPVLASQKEEYAFLQLQAFKDKTRKNDLNKIMQTITSYMSEEEMRAVSAYLSTY